MIRFLFRFIGMLCLAGAFVSFVYDVARIMMSPLSFLSFSSYTTVEKLWNELFSKSPHDVLQPLIAPYADSLWDPVIVPSLNVPVCLVLFVLGSILMLLGRKKRPLIGYARD